MACRPTNLMVIPYGIRQTENLTLERSTRSLAEMDLEEMKDPHELALGGDATKFRIQSSDDADAERIT